jgi:hypothetical protein
MRLNLRLMGIIFDIRAIADTLDCPIPPLVRITGS